jgi:8-oxo-dGTP pyrophosphatase MutT (NUDIX family)
MTQLTKEGAGVLFICHKTKRVCLSLRAPHKSHSMCWSLWGGMIEGNETPKECLMREFKEEIGFIPEISKLYPFDIYESRDKHFKFYTFICVVEKEFIPKLNDENIGYSWIDLEYWPKPMHQGAKKSLCSDRATEKLKLIIEQYK